MRSALAEQVAVVRARPAPPSSSRGRPGTPPRRSRSSAPTVARHSSRPGESAQVTSSTLPAGASAAARAPARGGTRSPEARRRRGSASVRAVPAPTTIASACARSAWKTRVSAALLIEPLLPDSPLAAPSRVLTMLTRSQGSRGRTVEPLEVAVVCDDPGRSAVVHQDPALPPHHPVLHAVRRVVVVDLHLVPRAGPGRPACGAGRVGPCPQLVGQVQVDRPERVRIAGSERCADRRVERRGPVVEVAGRLLGPCRGTVGHDEQSGGGPG